jgi:hypothetical protein
VRGCPLSPEASRFFGTHSEGDRIDHHAVLAASMLRSDLLLELGESLASASSSFVPLMIASA